MARRWMAGFLATLMLLGFAARAADPTPQEDAIVALAQSYGVVRYFHPATIVTRMPWDRVLLSATGRAIEVRDRADIGPMLQESFATLGPGVEFSRAPFSRAGDGPAPKYAISWRHAGIGVEQKNPLYKSWRAGADATPTLGGPLPSVNLLSTWHEFPLAGGWHARVRAAMSASDAMPTRAQLDDLERLERLSPEWNVKREEVRRVESLAAGIALWNVARHFYPYWSDVKTDWEADLRDWIRAQPERQARLALRDALRRLAANLDDGHAGVVDEAATQRLGNLPVAMRPLGSDLVVTVSNVPAILPGDVVESIDGRRVHDVMAQADKEVSAGAHAKAWRSRFAVTMGANGAHVALGVRRDGASRVVDLAYGAPGDLREKRPEAIALLRPGVYYVDVSRFDSTQFADQLAKLREARAIVFDLRGYPTRDAHELAGYWIDGKDEALWMHVPIFDRPFAETSAYIDIGWRVKPRAGLEKAAKILLTDPRAISYSESLTGYMAANPRAVIVGEPTFGANGDVSRVSLPGGYTFRFTGMVVTTHDGKRIHAKGFQPHVPVTPTIEGIRAGRDEVLEKAIEIALKAEPVR